MKLVRVAWAGVLSLVACLGWPGIGVGPVRAESAAPAPVDEASLIDPKRWALIIGVGEYGDGAAPLGPLRGPANDARRISEALINNGHFDPKQVIVVAEGTPRPPSRDEIMAQIADIVPKVGADGTFVLFFAGHGLASGGESYLLPATVRDVGRPDGDLFKSTAIPVSVVRSAVQQYKVGRAVFLIDACRSDPGAVAADLVSAGLARGMAGDVRGTAIAPDSNMVSFREAFNMANSVTIFATGAGQVAYETGGDESVGYFGDALARALSGDEPRAMNHIGEVTVGTLMDFLPDAVDHSVRSRHGKRQRPEIKANTDVSIVLAYPPNKPEKLVAKSSDRPARAGEGVAGPPRAVQAQLQVRLPDEAQRSGRLTVARNFFTVAQSKWNAQFTVKPGKQFIEVRLPGYQDWSKELDVEAGSAEVDVKLEPNRGPFWASLAAGVAGTAAVAAGFYYHERGRDLADEVNRGCSSGCTDFKPFVQKDREGHRANRLSSAFLIGGGVVGVAGLGLATFFHFSRPTLEPPPRAFGVAFGEAGAQASYRQRF